MCIRTFVVAALLLLVVPAYAVGDDIPESVQGRWVDKGEACDSSGGPMAISATSLVYPDGTFDDVSFEPGKDGGGVIHLRSEDVSSYEYDASDDTLLFRPKGFGMGSVFAMVRCQEPTSILERRCGWLANLTPGNWWLADADNTWILSEDGAYNPTVMDMVPAFDPNAFVSTGGDYGYSCACMRVTTDSAQDRILGITSSTRQPLATCRADPSLPALID